MSFLPLLTIPAFFLAFILIKPYLPKTFQAHTCAICASVSLSWIILLVLFWMGIVDDPVPVAALMGMTVTGLMYKIAQAYEKQGLRHLWAARLVIVLGGFLTITSVFQGNTGLTVLIVVGTFMLLLVITFLLQGTTHAQAVQAAGKDKAALVKKLDDCC